MWRECRAGAGAGAVGDRETYASADHIWQEGFEGDAHCEGVAMCVKACGVVKSSKYAKVLL